MVQVALLFPGQASQAVGMGTALRAESARARAIFDLADQVTGLPITRLCEDGPLDQLTATEVAQVAVVATSLAALTYLRQRLGADLKPVAVAGHSVGELAACVAADVLSEEEALRLVHARAQAMANACRQVDGTMAAVLELDVDTLTRLCGEESDETGAVEVANLNAPGQVVVSGERAAVARLGEAARSAGARRVLPLNVSGPFHSRYMQPAAVQMRAAVQAATLRSARVPLVGNVEARPLTTPEEIADELVTQVAAPVRWTDSLQRLAQLGCDSYLELGHGQVIAGMVRRTLPEASVASFGAPDAFDAARGALGLGTAAPA